MRICVVGAGAIGGVIAAQLAAVQDADVSVLARGATLSAIREHGLRVSSGAGETAGEAGETVSARVTASDDAAELGPQDFVVVAVKAQSMAGVAASVDGLLGEETAVLSTLNGVPWWFLDGLAASASRSRRGSATTSGTSCGAT